MNKIIKLGLVVIVVGGFVATVLAYSYLFSTNVKPSLAGYHRLYINNSDDWNSVQSKLDTLLVSSDKFGQIAEQMSYPSHIKPGYYEIPDSLSNLELVRLLRAGRAKDVRVTLNGGIQRDRIMGKIAQNLSVDSMELEALVDSFKIFDSLGYNKENWPCMFIPNTYFFNWATNPEDVLLRFEREKVKFWNDERLGLAEQKKLSPNEVYILASIVDAETMMSSELKRIAGVYLNRLNKNWPLGADPTIRYAIKEEGRQRVLTKDLKINSPYNTYERLGLPPGPILVPSVAAIDAVLHAEDHNYMYFCAKADFSGYHVFTTNGAAHARYARAYHRALNKRRIMK